MHVKYWFSGLTVVTYACLQRVERNKNQNLRPGEFILGAGMEGRGILEKSFFFFFQNKIIASFRISPKRSIEQ